MNCNKCGELLSEDSLFCAACGSPVQEEEIRETAHFESSPVDIPKKSKGKAAIIVLIAVAVITLLSVCIYLVTNLLSKTDISSAYPERTALLVINNEEEVRIFGADKTPVIVDGMQYSLRYSMDGNTAALTVDADDEGSGDMWYCDGKKAYSVADDVINFNFCASGSKIAYLTDYNPEISAGDLYIYDVQTKKSTLVSKEVNTSYAISPDGKSVAYASDISVDENGSLDGFTGYVSINGGEKEELGENKFAFALADGGKYIYYLEMDLESHGSGDLYIRQGKTDDKIGSMDMYNNYYLNKDCSELVFQKNDAEYICIDGKDKEKIFSMRLSSIGLPDGTQTSWNSVMGVYADLVNIDSLTDQLYVFQDTDDGSYMITYLQKDLTTQEIDNIKNDSYFDVTLSPDGKALYYINETGKIVYYKDYRNLKADPDKIRVDEDITSFIVMPEQSAVYFVDTENTLWVQRGTGEPEEIANELQTYSLHVSPDRKGIYYIDDYSASNTDEGPIVGTLRYISNAAKAKPVKISDEVYTVTVSRYGIMYSVYDDIYNSSYIGEMFFSQNGKDFESVMDDVFIG